MALILAGLLLVSVICVLAHYLSTVDFVDNPAWLVEVSAEGNATLHTYQGKITAPLAGVNWNTNPVVLAKVQELIDIAQRDKVAFAKTKAGKLRIWYPDESGPRCLNKEINAIPMQVPGKKSE
jgi:hypothetical protein